MTPRLEIEPGPHWWEASALTTTPPLLSVSIITISILKKTNASLFFGKGALNTKYRKKYIPNSSILENPH